MAAPLQWFPFYVDAFETDEAVRRMTYEERGIYLALLCWQWRERSLPGDAALVARTLGVRRAIVQRLFRLLFVDAGDTGVRRLVNPKLAEIYAHQIDKSAKARRAASFSHSKRLANAEQSLDERTRSAAQSNRRRVIELEKSLSASAERQTAKAVP